MTPEICGATLTTGNTTWICVRPPHNTTKLRIDAIGGTQPAILDRDSHRYQAQHTVVDQPPNPGVPSSP